MHWAVAYLGKPWVGGGRGPLAYDCWGLARAVQSAHYGRELPAIEPANYGLKACALTMRDHPERARWEVVDTPADGDLVLMAHARHLSHVGVWLDVDGGGVLHALQGAGVVFARLSALRDTGWGRIEFLRFRG